MPKDRLPSSCFDCAGVVTCYARPVPNLARDEARRIAAACTRLNKGRTVEVVQVQHRERGMSRKNAEELVSKGQAEWAGHRLVRLLQQPIARDGNA